MTRIFTLLALAMLAPSIAGASEKPASSVTPAALGSDSDREVVVLLHGLGRTRFSMSRLESSLRREGYRVVNVTYPSRTLSLEELAGTWLPDLLRAQNTDTAPRVHFVTHSMGGIVLRLWLKNAPVAPIPKNLGRIVMLAPPNQGSELADKLRTFLPFRIFTGTNGHRLGRSPDALPRQLGPVPTGIAVGIIAGNRTLYPFFSAWIAGDDDGIVSVESARLDGMSDFKVVPYSHTFLAWRRPVLDQIAAFLRTGAFTPKPL